jgi:hypothetical protein
MEPTGHEVFVPTRTHRGKAIYTKKWFPLESSLQGLLIGGSFVLNHTKICFKTGTGIPLEGFGRERKNSTT